MTLLELNKKPDTKFIDWYIEKNKILKKSGINTNFFLQGLLELIDLDFGNNKFNLIQLSVLKDAFWKLFYLAETTINQIYGQHTITDIEKAKKSYKIYDEVFFFVAHNNFIYIMTLPSCIDDFGNVIYANKDTVFENIDIMKKELEKITINNFIYLYNFYVDENQKIIMRMCIAHKTNLTNLPNI